ncbi:3-methylcrotonyl-CoA carboxylase subunit alpha [Iodidimonas muriae]|uniref:3-methylcrotonyl-CoA carboxylase subunit alpha n=1 Tax=Iodidimonas muriae TaxID=261467 RepID=A0ABQ2L700_9PROT|nr:acetyl/propionyl/methylcrotonyl-CoA carboxylase subunit alpha [Iodidimonas muriae]GGO05417.1 3-methylcrotonyl-CoA carboxylase subunit alpha [Iodidimonas muriae]
MTRLFNKILIANRGEIACRVIRTARAMGIGTVAVYSDADAHALHVDLADEAVHIGPAPAAQSYLCADKILDIAKRLHVDAIHPGYGFLSENADFAQTCEDAGIVFIGPTADSIRKMGLKDEAKRLMTLAGVPVVPGYLGADQSEAHLNAQAREIGYPVLIKAVAGGGGKGMRRVDNEKDFAASLKGAKREAAGAFGNDHVLIEKYIQKPRHIEVQVFADGRGHGVYLFERDCSLQRRHQKVVEEAPAPGMSPALRRKMGEAAVAAAQTIGYRGAGTVEFIVDVEHGLDGAPFYFMEMNTRLQVEHPVTEMISGEDLVEWQIRVAAGEPLPLDQGDLAIDGHAIEVRLYAEDPSRDFLPATGTLNRYRPPMDEDFTRVDTGVREHDSISVHYDPMIAKIITWGEDREAALHHMAQALSETEIAGLATNLPFLKQVIAHPEFASGNVDTGFIPRHADALLPEAAPASDICLALATLGILAAREDRAFNEAARSNDPFSPWHDPSGWQANLASCECQDYIDGAGTSRSVKITITDQGYRLEIGGQRYDAQIRAHMEEGEIEAEISGQIYRATILVNPEQVQVIFAGNTETLKRLSAKFDPEEDADGPGAITAPMPGKILDILVSDGDFVEKGQALLVLEAMKMEHTLTAPRDGTVSNLSAKTGDQVSDGAVLVTISD